MTHLPSRCNRRRCNSQVVSKADATNTNVINIWPSISHAFVESPVTTDKGQPSNRTYNSKVFNTYYRQTSPTNIL